jgi:hypothetical protein
MMYELALPVAAMTTRVPAAMPSESFTCPRCKVVTTDIVLARPGYCGNYQEFTGLCDAAFLAVALLTTGIVTMPGWAHPTAGTECWQVTGADGVATSVLLCASHQDRLRRGTVSWMESRDLKLAFGGTRRPCAVVSRAIRTVAGSADGGLLAGTTRAAIDAVPTRYAISITPGAVSFREALTPAGAVLAASQPGRLLGLRPSTGRNCGDECHRANWSPIQFISQLPKGSACRLSGTPAC